jgi:putative SOS response-associated peptidase YedK
MPVLLAAKDQARWLGGTPDEALALCQPWAGAIAINRTDQPWAKGAAHQPGLL